ncbi:MAG: hypothetical protein U0800_23425 [Isosphaeraceae bacterium]
MNPTETEALVVRLDRIERENRYLRWIGSGLFLALAGLMAAAPGMPLGRSRLQADRFELKDSQGRVRANLGFTREGAPGLFLLDDHGREQIAMVAQEQSTTIDLSQQGRPRMSMMATIDGSSTLQFFNSQSNVPSALYMWPDGASGLFLSGRESPVHLVTSQDGPARLSLLDRDFREMGSYRLSTDGTFDWHAVATSSVATGRIESTIEQAVSTNSETL